MRYFTKTFMQMLDFKGRSNRKEYWAFSLFLLVSLSLFYVANEFRVLWFFPSSTHFFIEAFSFIFGAFLFISWLSLSVRRFHDMGLKAWFPYTIGAMFLLLVSKELVVDFASYIMTYQQITDVFYSLTMYLSRLVFIFVLFVLSITNVAMCLFEGPAKEDKKEAVASESFESCEKSKVYN